MITTSQYYYFIMSKNLRNINLLIMKKYPRTVLYDKLHRGFVLCCVGLTLYGSIILGDHFYKYFKYRRPLMQASKATAEQELLSEGSSEKVM
ncbi:unnamed protein product [Pieris brassicae]|uniref:Uncharacterized protein n=1 Tax=Pieris brassicae TaxID=7116 RepID=A0A9P0TBI6_PIEBR|nr:unnamed protein product [Pieris brassicae]